MKVAVVTPYYRESDEILKACLDSVRDQTHENCRHFMVADGFPNPLVDTYDTTHVKLPAGHADNGNAARCIGAFAAIADEFDAIAFLDADNWFRPDHIARMVALQARSGASLCTSGRSVHGLDGSLLVARDGESDGIAFADTSCMCFFRPSFDLMSLWGTMPRSAGPVCDKIMWDAIRLREISRAHDPEPTVAFRSQYAFHYEVAGIVPPEGAKSNDDQRDGWKRFQGLPYVHKTGLELGLGGTQDLTWLHKSLPGKRLRTLRLSLPGRTDGLALEVPEGEITEAAVREIFVEQPFRPAPGLAPPKAVLDIGSGVGLAAAYFRLVYPDAFLQSLEPDPRTFKILNRNAKVIGNCAAVCAGLTFGTQIRPFQVGERSSAVAVTAERYARQLLLDAERFVQALRKKDYDLINIDAEGAEIPILLSLRKRLVSTPVVLVKFHSNSDRRIIDAILADTHALSRSTAASPDRGTLCYVNRTLTGKKRTAPPPC
jgi:FkbM family methyltransferase